MSDHNLDVFQFHILTTSYQITTINPIPIAIPNWKPLRCSKLKNAVNGGTYNNKAVMKTVIEVIIGIKLFLYWMVVSIE